MPSFMPSEPTTPKEPLTPWEPTQPGVPMRTPEDRIQKYLTMDQDRDLWIRKLVYENQSLKRKVKSVEHVESQVKELNKSIEQKTREIDIKSKDFEIATKRIDQQALELRKVEEIAAANPFALVLVDGDGYIFPDDLLTQAFEGGETAAQRLHDDINQNLERFKGSKEWSVVVRVFVNLEGLARECEKLDIIQGTSTLRDFAAGFIRSKPLFDFIDVGPGKERTDHKIRETFTLFVKNIHCRHIFFGGCHDNGYVRVLESWKNNAGVASRISLMQHHTIGREYKKLPFEWAPFGSFRDRGLQTRPSARSTQYPAEVVTSSVPTRPGSRSRTRRSSTPGREPSNAADNMTNADGNGNLKRPRTSSFGASTNPPLQHAYDVPQTPSTTNKPTDPRLNKVATTSDVDALSGLQVVPVRTK